MAVSKMKTRLVISITCLGIILIAGFVLGKPRFVDPSSQPPNALRAVLQPNATPSLSWKIYDDPIINFSFQYPNDWFLYPPASEGYAKTLVLSNFDLETALPTQGEYQQGQIKIEFSSSQTPLNSGEDLTTWIRDSYLHPSSEITSSQEVTVDSLKGVRINFMLFNQRHISLFFERPLDLFFVSVVSTDATSDTLIESILQSIIFN